jgi:hypothetical protein
MKLDTNLQKIIEAGLMVELPGNEFETTDREFETIDGVILIIDEQVISGIAYNGESYFAGNNQVEFIFDSIKKIEDGYQLIYQNEEQEYLSIYRVNKVEL